MKPLLCFLLALVTLSGCSTAREAERARKQIDRYTKSLWQQEPVRPDSISGYLPNPEINLLDALQRKYPGTTKTRVVTKVETVTLPGKTVYVNAVPIKVEEQANQVKIDSLLSQIKSAALNAKENSQLKVAYANLRVSLLKELNRRGCLPDTMIEVQGLGFRLTMHVIPRANNTYDFVLTRAQQDLKVATAVTETTQQRPVQAAPLVWWRDR